MTQVSPWGTSRATASSSPVHAPARFLGWAVLGVLVGAVLVLLWGARPGGVTEFAAGYSQAGFARLRPGDPAGRVLELLGNPLVVSRGPHGLEYWSYTKAPAPQHMVVRAVVMDAGGQVREVRRSVNWDYLAHVLSGGRL